MLFDVVKDGQNVCPKWVPREEEQESNESRRLALSNSLDATTLSLFKLFRLWHDLTQAIIAKDMDKATEAKSAVEDAQREQRRKMEENRQTHVPRFFEQRDGRWVPKIECVFPLPGFPFLS